MTINIVMDTKATRKDLKFLERDQYPFALAVSLTKTAKGAQERVQRVSKRKFNIRSRYTLRNIRIEPSSKADVRRGIAESAVFTDDRIVNYMVGHEGGQIRRGQKSRFIAIPGPALKKQVFRGAGGRVKKRFRPSVLLQGMSKNRAGVNQKKKSRSRRAFIVSGKGNTSLIVRRQTVGNSKPLELLYTLKKTVDVKKNWDFEKNVRVSVKLNFKRIFEHEMRKAIGGM